MGRAAEAPEVLVKVRGSFGQCRDVGGEGIPRMSILLGVA